MPLGNVPLGQQARKARYQICGIITWRFGANNLCLNGENILIEAEILGMADVVEACISLFYEKGFKLE
jgi:hypothetical protein